MKVRFNGKEYEYKPTGKSSVRGGGLDINGNYTETRIHTQYGLYDEFGVKDFTCGSGSNIDNSIIRIYKHGKIVGYVLIPNSNA